MLLIFIDNCKVWTLTIKIKALKCQLLEKANMLLNLIAALQIGKRIQKCLGIFVCKTVISFTGWQLYGSPTTEKHKAK